MVSKAKLFKTRIPALELRMRELLKMNGNRENYIKKKTKESRKRPKEGFGTYKKSFGSNKKGFGYIKKGFGSIKKGFGSNFHIIIQKYADDYAKFSSRGT